MTYPIGSPGWLIIRRMARNGGISGMRRGDPARTDFAPEGIGVRDDPPRHRAGLATAQHAGLELPALAPLHPARPRYRRDA